MGQETVLTELQMGIDDTVLNDYERYLPMALSIMKLSKMTLGVMTFSITRLRFV
jgi:hypothetical protein